MTEEQYHSLMEELQKMREIMEEEKRRADEMWKILMKDDWK